MVLDEKSLRDVTEADIRSIVEAQLSENIRLEYKGALYPNSDAGRREFLLDVCMLANAQGGILLVGIPERRDAAGQPTGTPDGTAVLGLEVANPEALLQSYGARIESCIEERLQVESHAVRLGENRFVLALRVPNSTAKPHCVRYQGHVYFPCRRERHRGNLDIREIKEMSIYATARVELAANLLAKALADEPRTADSATMMIGWIPVFFRDFLVDIGREEIRTAVGQFHVRTRLYNHQEPRYSFDGLIRESEGDTTTLARNGMIRSRSDLRERLKPEGNAALFHCNAIDVLLRNFVLRTQAFLGEVQIAGPFLLGAALAVPLPLITYDRQGFEDGAIGAGYYEFPSLQITDPFGPFENLIRPLCDYAHQMFGETRSPCFDGQGRWALRD